MRSPSARRRLCGICRALCARPPSTTCCARPMRAVGLAARARYAALGELPLEVRLADERADSPLARAIFAACLAVPVRPLRRAAPAAPAPRSPQHSRSTSTPTSARRTPTGCCPISARRCRSTRPCARPTPRPPPIIHDGPRSSLSLGLITLPAPDHSFVTLGLDPRAQTGCPGRARARQKNHRFLRALSDRADAAVERQDRAGDLARFVGGQIERHPGDVLGRAGAEQRLREQRIVVPQ